MCSSSISKTVIAAAVLCLITTAPVFGAILHADGEPGIDWTDKPHDDVVGRWGNNASCVAISPNYVISTSHQGNTSTVDIGGETYTVAQSWRHPSADMRVARLENANLANYVSPYTGTDEIGKDFVLGGYGKGRGAELFVPKGFAYGYEWLGTDNHTQRWGTNHVDSAGTGDSGGTPYSSDVLRADFDENGTDYEVALAEWDSGGGWFIKVGDEWQLAGLSAYVEHDGETWFRNSGMGQPDPDVFRGIRVSSYNMWISGTLVPEPGTMILLSLGAIGLIRRRRKA